MVDLLGGRAYTIPTQYGIRIAEFWGFHTGFYCECDICGKATKNYFSFTDKSTEGEIIVGTTCVAKVSREVA